MRRPNKETARTRLKRIMSPIINIAKKEFAFAMGSMRVMTPAGMRMPTRLRRMRTT